MTYFAFDAYNQFEKPAFTLANPDGTELFNLGSIYDRGVELRFNALSKLTFTAPSRVDGVDTDYYNYLDYRRLVKVNNVATFMITELEKNNDGIIETINITCESLETQLSGIKLSLYKGTKNFYNILTPTDTLLDDLLLMIPAWSLNYIDPTLCDVFRTFDVTDKTVYDFMMNEVSQTYQCVFSFDTINKTISVYSVTNATVPTDIFLSFNNLIEKRVIKTVTSEIATALTVLGGQNISINQVNPIGTNIIYNFGYFKTINWMTQDLIDAITNWENKTVNYQSIYSQLLYDLQVLNTSLLVLQNEMVELESTLASYQNVLDARVKQGLPHIDVDAQIIGVNGSITLKQGEIDTKQGNMDSLDAQLHAINLDLSFATNFTIEQLSILNSYTIGSTYTNTNFVSYDTTSLSDIRAEAQELYDLAQVVLTKVSQPRYTIDIDSVNFPFLHEFETFANQLVLGCTVTVDLDNGVYLYPVLLGLDFNYDDPNQFKMTFSNRVRLDDASFQYGDLFNRVANLATTTQYNKQQWNTWLGYQTSDLPAPTNVVGDGGKVPTLSSDGTRYYLLPVPTSAHTIQDTGSAIVPRPNLNFTGGVTITDDIDNGATLINIDSSSGSGTFGWSFPFNVSGSSLSVAGYIKIPYTCNINEAELVANDVGNIVVDIWNTPYADFPPIATDSICASAKPTLATAIKMSDTTLTGWSASLTGGDWLGIAYSGMSGLSFVTLSLKGITISGSEGGYSGNSSLRIKTIDGATSVPNVSVINVTNGTLTDNTGGTVTISISGSSGGTGTLTQIDTGTGLSGGPITGSGTISLANTSVASGSYTNPTLTIDQQGRIVAASNGTSGSSGTVTQISTGVGLTGGPITTSGCIAIANTAVTPGSYTNPTLTIDQQGRIVSASSGGGGTGNVIANGTGTPGNMVIFTIDGYHIADGGTPLTDLSDSDPQTIQLTSDSGSSVEASRSDHIHKLDGLWRAIKDVTTTYQVLIHDDVIMASASISFNVTLPYIADQISRCYTLINVGSASVTLLPRSPDTIGGAASIGLSQWERTTVIGWDEDETWLRID